MKQDSEQQLGEAVAVIARVYLALTGRSLPEFDSYAEIGQEIIGRIEELKGGGA